jgi:hypothetical protein
MAQQIFDVYRNAQLTRVPRTVELLVHQRHRVDAVAAAAQRLGGLVALRQARSRQTEQAGDDLQVVLDTMVRLA